MAGGSCTCGGGGGCCGCIEDMRFHCCVDNVALLSIVVDYICVILAGRLIMLD